MKKLFFALICYFLCIVQPLFSHHMTNSLSRFALVSSVRSVSIKHIIIGTGIVAILYVGYRLPGEVVRTMPGINED